MDKNELLKDLKKVDMNLIKQSDIKMFQAEKMAVQYYNNAVDNIVEGNTDIAVIKLKKVLSLSPDFSEASQLLERISEFEKSHSIGDKVYESMHGRNINDKRPYPERKTLPQMLNIKPRILIKMIIVLVVIAITVGAVIVIFKLFDKETSTETPEPEAVTYSQEEVDEFYKRIEELESSLAKSEIETQEALSASTGSDETINQLRDENETMLAQLNLYKAEVLFQREEYELSADMAKSLNAEAYKGADKELYNEVYNKAIYQAALSRYKTGLNLYSQKDFVGAIEHLEMVDEYSPEFEDLGNCYYVLAKAYYEIDKAEKSIELYETISKNMSQMGFENDTGLLYYTGKAYQKLDNFVKAREMYNKLIADFPNSTLVGYAKDRLKEME
ncbi:MAG: tetratricopeptide repeat protein [Clostridiales bacterium]|nr:tetratricopeptide repeat protein [Clostridiales bacterium]